MSDTLADRFNQWTFHNPHKLSTRVFGRIDARSSAKGRWIKEHARGDASKGWVQQEYVVEAS